MLVAGVAIGGCCVGVYDHYLIGTVGLVMFAIEVEGLSKSYAGFSVLREMGLRVDAGEVYGLLGPNGAGKSTFLHVLLGFLKPDRGLVRVLGADDVDAVRGRIGYLPERLRYHLRYSAREYLRYLGYFSDMREPQLSKRVDEELRTVGLHDAADRQLGMYSKGMLQRFGIAQALLTDPDMLVIDEPTSGLDPTGQQEMLDLLAEVRRRGHTILLTTHFIEEAEQLCDRVGVLFGGRIAAEVAVARLRGTGSGVVIQVVELPGGVAQEVQRFSPAVHCSGRMITLQPNTPGLQAQVLRALLDANVTILGMETRGRPLEDMYLRVVRGEPLPPLPEPAPPNSLFAPPGHADAVSSRAEGASGEVLLRELLGGDSGSQEK